MAQGSQRKRLIPFRALVISDAEDGQLEKLQQMALSRAVTVLEGSRWT